MSKTSEAKEAQGYRTEQRNCRNCAHMTFSMEWPKWMRDRFERGDTYYQKDVHKQECGHQCSIGGFAIKLTATCDRWEVKA